MIYFSTFVEYYVNSFRLNVIRNKSLYHDRKCKIEQHIINHNNPLDIQIGNERIVSHAILARVLLVSVIDIGLIWLDTDIFGIIHITIFSRQGTQMMFFYKIDSTIQIGYNSLFSILLHIFQHCKFILKSSEVLLKVTHTKIFIL